MIFRDRCDAGQQLAKALAGYKDQHPIIIALPRGGVPVGAEVAAALGAPLDIVLVRKVGAPIQPELALGAVVNGGEPVIVRNPQVMESTATNEEEFRNLCDIELKEIERRRSAFCGDRPPVDIAARVVVLVDDGMATGATARAAIRSLKTRMPQKLVLAVPVAPADTLESLRQEVDDIVCLTDLGGWGAIGYFYDDFRQLSDRDVVAILSRFAPSTGAATETHRPAVHTA